MSQLDLTQLRVSTVPDAKMVGRPLYAVVASQILLNGETYVYGNDIELSIPDTCLTISYLRSPLPRWWHIDAPAGAAFVAIFNRPGMLAPVIGRPKAMSGELLAAPRAQPLRGGCEKVRLSSSAPLIVNWAGQTAESGAPNEYPPISSVIAVPSVLIAQGGKNTTTQGAAGPTSLYTPSGVGPAYLRFVCSIPSADPPTSPSHPWVNPLFVYIDATDFPTRPGGTTPTRLLLGDISSLLRTPGPGCQQVDFTLIIDHNVTGVGYWFPSIESQVNPGAATARYWGITVGIYPATSVLEVPLSGGPSLMAYGYVRPTLPGAVLADGVWGGANGR